MTINPVDMQVLIPQTGQVNKIQRALQNQQQTEQQIIGQLIQEEMNKKEHSVKTLKEAEQKKIEERDAGTRQQKQNAGTSRESGTNLGSIEDKHNQEIPPDEFIGRNFDVKI